MATMEVAVPEVAPQVIPDAGAVVAAEVAEVADSQNMCLFAATNPN